jgi:hypothetical protein
MGALSTQIVNVSCRERSVDVKQRRRCFRLVTCEQDGIVTFTGRGSRVWVGMVLAGLVLGAYVVSAWPDASQPAVARPAPVRTTASVSYPESEQAGVAAAFYPSDLYGFYFEPGTTPALDALISAPPPLDAG